MSPRFYSYLWIAYAAAAGFLWIAGMFTMLTLVVFGFVAFGLVFAGMVCVLPGVVSHPQTQSESKRAPRDSTGNGKARVGVPIGLRPH